MPVRSLFCRKADPLSFQMSVYVQAPKQIRKKCSPHSKSGRVNHPSAFLHKKPSVSFLMEADTILFCLHDLPCIFTTRKIMTPQERPVSALSQNKEVAAFRTTIVIIHCLNIAIRVWTIRKIRATIKRATVNIGSSYYQTPGFTPRTKIFFCCLPLTFIFHNITFIFNFLYKDRRSSSIGE